MPDENAYAENLQALLEAEQHYIESRRRKAAEEFPPDRSGDGSSNDPADIFPDDRPIGLSFSGGGLRSATFNLGVVQSLAKHGILPFVDYLSTVSGGGYLGSSLTSLLNLHRHEENATGFCEDDCEDPNHPHEEPPNFPFSTQYRNFPFNPEYNLFESAGSSGDIIGTNPQLDHMRRVGNFLIQRLGLVSRDFVRTIGAILSGIFYTIGLFILVLVLFSAAHYAVMGILVPGISEAGIPVIALTKDNDNAANEAPSLFELYDEMVGASFKKYDPATQSFLPAPPIYITALLSGMIGSVVWALIVLPYYTGLVRKRERQAAKRKRDPDIPVLWATGIAHFLVIMVVFTWLRVSDNDSSVNQLYWMWFPVFYVAGTAIAAYIIYYLLSLKPILMTFPAVTSRRRRQKFSGDTAALQSDLTPEQRSIYYSYVGIQTQGVVLISLAALLAIPHYFQIETPVSGVTVPGGAAILSALWAYILQQRAQRKGRSGSSESRVKISFSLVKLGLNLLVLIAILGSIFMIEVIFEQTNLGANLLADTASIPVLNGITSFLYGLTQPTTPFFGLRLDSRAILFTAAILLIFFEFVRTATETGALADRIAPGTYYKNGVRLLIPPVIALLAVNLGYSAYFYQHVGLVGIIVLAVLLYLLLYLYGFINANNISLHYFYRDRIADAFLKTDITRKDGSQTVARDNRSMLLSQLNHLGCSAPYHLIMGAINLQGSKDIKLKGRKTGPFTFSKYYCGSDITGFVQTRAYRRGTNKLSRAVTISGAAFSSSVGILTFFGQAFMLTLLNVRLGMWFKNPRLYREQDAARSLSLRGRKTAEAKYSADASAGEESSMLEKLLGWLFELIETWTIWPRYLFNEATGSINENLPLVNVTDGGHFENMGLYPLLQRRCKLIISGDASADPEYTANDLARVIRQINIDENIRVDIDLNSLAIHKETGMTPEHYTVGKITYPPTPAGDEETGWLIYIKPAMNGDEPADITNYWESNRESKFPHQSTADQFYDENQFEAYRHLGEHSVDTMLDKIDLPEFWDVKKMSEYVREKLAPALQEEL